MPETPSVISRLHSLAARLGSVNNTQKADIDDLKGVKSTLVAAVAELARATQQYVDLQAWAATQGYVPSSTDNDGE